MTTPGEMVANLGKNWRMDRARKKLGEDDTVTLLANKAGIIEQEQNTHVGYPPELFQQIPREKGDDSVLGRDHLVGRICVLSQLLLGQRQPLVRQLLVDIDRPGRPRLVLGREEIFDGERGHLCIECRDFAPSGRGLGHERHGD